MMSEAQGFTPFLDSLQGKDMSNLIAENYKNILIAVVETAGSGCSQALAKALKDAMLIARQDLISEVGEDNATKIIDQFHDEIAVGIIANID